jgi:hypothetical protein
MGVNDRKVVNDDGSITVTLSKPVKMSGEDCVTSLRFRGEATIEDLMSLDKGDGGVAKTVRIISELASVPIALVKKISSKDFVALISVVNEITGDTGGNLTDDGV